MNGINAVCATGLSAVVRGVVNFCAAAPGRLASWVAWPAQQLEPSARRDPVGWKVTIREAVTTETIPVGVTLLASVLGLAVLLLIAL